MKRIRPHVVGLVAAAAALVMAAAARAQDSTFEQVRWPPAPAAGCQPSARLKDVADRALTLFPGLAPPPGVVLKMHYYACPYGPGGNTTSNRWGRHTQSSLSVRQDVLEGDALRLAVVVVHELAHAGTTADGREAEVGADGHGYPFLERLIGAGASSVAYEVVGPGGVSPQHLAAYRRASSATCGASSCGEVHAANAALVELAGWIEASGLASKRRALPANRQPE